MPKTWNPPPIIYATYKVQQLRARLEQLVLHEKLQRAKSLLATQERKLKEHEDGR